jgi:hypothetical protein
MPGFERPVVVTSRLTDSQLVDLTTFLDTLTGQSVPDTFQQAVGHGGHYGNRQWIDEEYDEALMEEYLGQGYIQHHASQAERLGLAVMDVQTGPRQQNDSPENENPQISLVEAAETDISIGLVDGEDTTAGWNTIVAQDDAGTTR